MKIYKSSENIQKKEGWPDRSDSNNQLSSVTLHFVIAGCLFCFLCIAHKFVSFQPKNMVYTKYQMMLLILYLMQHKKGYGML